MVVEAAFWGLIGASALVVGAEVAFAFRLSSKVIGLIMAFGVGALISSISFELVQPSLESASVAQVSLALLIGALKQIVVQIFPLEIHVGNHIFFICPLPPFHSFLLNNSTCYIMCLLEPDQLMTIIFLGETLY